MRPAAFGTGRLLLRGLVHHRRTHLGSALGAAVACAVLTGALIVGDSVRESLRALAGDRLGKVDCAILSGRPFRTALAGELQARLRVAASFEPPAAALLLRGSGSAPGPDGLGPRLCGVSIIGVDAAGLDLLTPSRGERPEVPRGRKALVNRRLAQDLGLKPGDPLVLWLPAASPVPREFLAGRREDAARSARFEVAQVIPDRGAGRFSLSSDQRTPRQAIVDIEELSRVLLLKGRAGALLFEARAGDAAASGLGGARLLEGELRHAASAEDLGLKVMVRGDRGFLQIESESFQIDPAAERALAEAAGSLSASATAISTYLANAIALSRPGSPRREIPYSTVAALDPAAPPPLGPLVLDGGGAAPSLAPGEILLSAWAARDLGAQEGDRIDLEYFVVGRGGEIETARASFRVRGIAAPSGGAVDPYLTPEFPGLTTAARIGDWDPPFPVDLKRIRPVDEAYWREHRAAPKAFIALEEGRRLWGGRFGSATAVRVAPPAGMGLPDAEARLREKLREVLDPARLGLSVRSVREEASLASEGSTDFATLFLAFSFFLILAAGLLAGLFWAIGLHRRAREWGILRAAGFSARRILRLSILEGLLVCGLGELAGLAAAPLYSRLLLSSLRGRWTEAMRPPRLELHANPASFALGYLAALGVVLLATVLAARKLSAASPRALLGGSLAPLPSSSTAPRARGRKLRAGAGPAFAAGLLLVAALLTVPALFSARYAAGIGPAAFFGAGAAILGAGIFLFAASLRKDRRPATPRGAAPGKASALLWLGLRNARRHPGRSVLTAALMACASFVIVATAAMRGGEDREGSGLASGTGGFQVAATTEVPVYRRLDLESARADLGIPPSVGGRTVDWEGSEVMAFRVKDGDDSSCLNLYRTLRPRILGAPPEFLRRGGFRFHAALAGTAEESRNPWLLLERPPGATGSRLAIADEATASWALHLALGEEIEVDDGRGGKARLRLAASLEGSILQGALVISEADLLALFPGAGGRRFFLIGAPPERVDPIVRALAEGLEPYGFDPVSTSSVLEDYRSVERAYLDTFQALGGMGLLLGAAGLGAVLLRGALERRGELALLRALGYRRSVLLAMVVCENLLLVVAGLSIGCLAALAASAPHLRAGFSSVPWGSLAWTLAGAAAVGLLAGLAAAVSVVRAPLVPALRSE